MRQLDACASSWIRRPGGTSTARNPKVMTVFVRDGDTVLVHSMHRLTRNLDDLCRFVRRLAVKRVHLRS
jgi:hypothetical protein